MNDLLSYFRQTLPTALELLGRMVNMESPSLDKTLVDRFARFAGDNFAAIGGRVDYVPVARFGDHLRVRFFPAGESGKAGNVLLLGHTDTVFPAGEAVKRPFRIENGHAAGPGVFDMKAGIVLAWWALKALSERKGPWNPVTVLLTSDEEVGSLCSRGLIEEEAARARAVLVLEPSLPGGALKTARKGVGRFAVKALGRAAHAGVDPAKGINAIEEIAHQVIQLHRLTNIGSGTTVSVGTIHGGTRTNVVPAEAAVEIDLRVSSLEEAERLTRAIHGLRPYLPGAQLEVRGEINRPPMERTSETVRLFEIARALAAEIGVTLQEGSTGGASDGNFTSAMGVPTLDGLGAIGDGAHAIDEFVDVGSLPERASLIAGLIERL